MRVTAPLPSVHPGWLAVPDNNISDTSLTSTQRSWNLILDGSGEGPFNMAFDEVLLRHVSSPGCPHVTYLRFYQWERPTLSLGFSQKAARITSFEFCRQHNIPIVRRLTGGKAVLHDRELTYSVVSNDPTFFPPSDITATYARIAEALLRGLAHLGVEATLTDRVFRPSQPLSSACFAVANHHELLWKDKKLVGSAQHRTRDSFLQHGSIPIEFNARQLAGCLGLADVAGMEQKVTDLHSAVGHSPSPQEIASAMSRGFCETFGIRLHGFEFSARLLDEARQLAATKYAHVVWDRPMHLLGTRC